ncbi:MAG: hypothetical protein N3A38_17135 [Planctomycetota bacterium]|nr:hypothetical protein [Planctomycetota bacterium]
MSRIANVVILCEDSQHEAFIRRFLRCAGVEMSNQPRVEKAPGGRGAGAQFVRERFPVELKYYRNHSHRAGQVLIVMLDADRYEVDERVRWIDGAVPENQRRRPDERVAVFVPARNIETWLAYLSGQEVNETDTYQRLERERDCRAPVERLQEMCRAGRLRPPAPPSLEAACAEYRARLQDAFAPR